jgi:hypothetical protein
MRERRTKISLRERAVPVCNPNVSCGFSTSPAGRDGGRKRETKGERKEEKEFRSGGGYEIIIQHHGLPLFACSLTRLVVRPFFPEKRGGLPVVSLLARAQEPSTEVARGAGWPMLAWLGPVIGARRRPVEAQLAADRRIGSSVITVVVLYCFPYLEMYCTYGMRWLGMHRT